jgi:hypothetical protein
MDPFVEQIKSFSSNLGSGACHYLDGINNDIINPVRACVRAQAEEYLNLDPQILSLVELAVPLLVLGFIVWIISNLLFGESAESHKEHAAAPVPATPAVESVAASTEEVKASEAAPAVAAAESPVGVGLEAAEEAPKAAEISLSEADDIINSINQSSKTTKRRASTTKRRSLSRSRETPSRKAKSTVAAEESKKEEENVVPAAEEVSLVKPSKGFDEAGFAASSDEPAQSKSTGRTGRSRSRKSEPKASEIATPKRSARDRKPALPYSPGKE